MKENDWLPLNGKRGRYSSKQCCGHVPLKTIKKKGGGLMNGKKEKVKKTIQAHIIVFN